MCWWCLIPYYGLNRAAECVLMRGVDSVDEESRDVPPAILPDQLHPWALPGSTTQMRSTCEYYRQRNPTNSYYTAVEDETVLN